MYSEDKLRTAKQWEEAGRRIKAEAEGVLMLANRHSKRLYRYYLVEDTEKCNSNSRRV